MPEITQKNLMLSKNIDEATFRILLVGRIDRNKVPQHTIDLIYKLKKKIPNIKLTIIGYIFDYAFFRGLEERAKQLGVTNNITFMKKVDEKILQNLYSQTDVYISLSYSESFGYTIVEALSHGLPIVATRTGIVPYLETKHALIGVDYGDIDQITEAISSIYEDKSSREKLIRNALKIREEFKMEAYLQKLAIRVLGI
jgi:poly(glycerol-phosphate) alpha-glucosyltransferase